MAKAIEFAFLGANDRPGGHHTTIKINWHHLLKNWVKLNTNGFSIGNLGLSGGGGLIRNTKGEWVRGFAKAIGVTTSVASELWALRDRIRLYIALKIPTVIIELDAKPVVDLL